MKKILLALLLLAFTNPIIAQNYEITAETALREKAQSALDKIYGLGNFVVDVDIDVTEPGYEVKYTEQSKPKLNGNKSDVKVNLLPGYPVIKNLGPGNMNQLPFDSITTYIKPRVLRKRVNLIVNRSFSRSQAGRAQALLKDLLEIRDNRDKITVTYQPFYEADELRRASGNAPTILDELLRLDRLIIFGSILWFTLLFIVYIIVAIRSGKGAKGDGEKGGNAPSVNINPNIEIPESSGGGSSSINIDTKVKRYFDFISESNIDDLIYLLKKENVSMENVSIIVSFLPSRLGAKVLSELDIENQAVVTANILGQRLVNRPYLDKLEGKIRDWIECLVGGESNFQKLFNFVSGEVKKKLLGILSKNNPDAYQLFREFVIIFEDLKYMEDEEMKLVLSDANVELLSTALVGVDEETQAKVNTNLAQNAKEMIRQYLDLKGQTISKQDIEAAQDYVLGIVDKLEAEGKVDLRGKVRR